MEILTTTLSIVGSIVAVSVTYFLNKRNEREAEWRKEKLKFYMTFFEALSGITECEQTPENDIKFAKAMNDLHLFAPSPVISALHKFQDEIRISNPNQSSERSTVLLSKLVLEIRKDIKITSDNPENFSVLLWTSGHKK